MIVVSEKTIARLVQYRRLLHQLAARGVASVHSHELAALAQVSAAQVRRDFMALIAAGTPMHGYDVAALLEALRAFLDAPEGQAAALVGIGNLGKAILTYFAGRRPKLVIAAAFDIDPAKVHRLFRSVPCYPVEELPARVRELGIRLGIITVPAAAAQAAADQLIRAGVRGLVNFAPVPLQAPEGVFVEDIDIAMSLEKVAFFARSDRAAEPARGGRRPAPRLHAAAV